MAKISLNDPNGFAENLLVRYLEQGFQSLSKRDTDLLIFLLLERDGAYIAAASDSGQGEAAAPRRLCPLAAFGG